MVSDYIVIQRIADWQERELWQYVYFENDYKEISVFYVYTFKDWEFSVNQVCVCMYVYVSV